MLICSDGSVYSFEGVLANWRGVVSDYIQGWGPKVTGCAINYENSDIICDLTGEPIASAYGD